MATSARSTSYWHNENPPQTSWFIFEKAQEEFKILCFFKKRRNIIIDLFHSFRVRTSLKKQLRQDLLFHSRLKFTKNDQALNNYRIIFFKTD